MKADKLVNLTERLEKDMLTQCQSQADIYLTA